MLKSELLESGGMLHAETLPVSGTSLGNLDMTRLADYLVNVAGDLEAPATTEGWERRLEGLGLLVTGEDGRPVCTIAGLVLFGRSPRRSLRQAGVRCMGVRRKIVPLTREYTGRDAQFDLTEDHLRVVIPARTRM